MLTLHPVLLDPFLSNALSFSSVQFNSHFILSPIGARTLKMPVPYLPPSVGAYTQTPLFFLLENSVSIVMVFSSFFLL